MKGKKMHNYTQSVSYLKAEYDVQTCFKIKGGFRWTLMSNRDMRQPCVVF